MPVTSMPVTSPPVQTGTDTAAAVTDALLWVDGVTKRFGSLVANHRVSFHVHAGEVHALLGENGAGKSTLVKVLYGVHRADEGRVVLDGVAAHVSSPARARDLGLGMVFQDLRLVPALTVWENIALHAGRAGRLLRPRRIQAEIAEVADRWGLAVDPAARVADLSIGERQRVELLKVLMSGARVLILDEPTSVLTPAEVDALFDVVGRLRADGVGIVIITHKMREVRTIADRVTVLRGGQVVVADRLAADISDEDLVTAMVGTTVEAIGNTHAGGGAGRPLLQVRGLHVRGAGEGSGLRGIDLGVGAGEIVGVAGVAGNGQRELADVAVGAARPDAGAVLVDGETMPANDPAAFRRAGVCSVLADPLREFVVPGLTVAEHAALWSSAGTGRIHFDVAAAAGRVADAAAWAGLSIAAPDRRLDQLSGGNIQRVLLTLALGERSPVLVVSYPTRGLDVLTAETTRRLLLDARGRGQAVLLVSEDLDELLAVSDRIAVLAHGRVAGIVDAAGADRRQLGRLMTGAPADGAPGDGAPDDGGVTGRRMTGRRVTGE